MFSSSRKKAKNQPDALAKIQHSRGEKAAYNKGYFRQPKLLNHARD